MLQTVVAMGASRPAVAGQAWQAGEAPPEVRADVGWTGMTHKLGILQGAQITADLLGCDGISDQLCDINASVAGDFFGAPSPLASGGVAYCVALAFVSDLTGTINLGTGEIVEEADLEAKVFVAGDISEPCPACLTLGPVAIGEPGVCDGGAADGEPCTVEGLGDEMFGPNRATSNDCAPIAGSQLAEFGVHARPATTGTVSFVAAVPCTAFGSQGEMCWCDSCAGGDNPNAACSSDSDCPGGGICGAKRCIGGADDGELCASSTECESQLCSRPGTLPNACYGGASDCVPAADGIGGECASGPEDSQCEEVRYRRCVTDDDCLSGSCVSVPRPCFRDPIERSGVPDPVVDRVAHPTLVGTMCFAPTSSAAVNGTAGFPGPVAFIWPSEIRLLP